VKQSGLQRITEMLNNAFPKTIVIDTSQVTNSQATFLEKYTSQYKRNRLAKLKKRQDYVNAIIGDICIKLMGSQYLDVKALDIELAEDAYKKPYIMDLPNFKFNISHSKNIVTCIFDQEDVGIDIEQISKLDPALAKFVLSESEYDSFRNSLEPVKYFYRLWTLKESYLKAIGSGLISDLREISFDLPSYESPNSNYVLGEYFFSQIEYQNNFLIATCTKNEYQIKTEKLLCSTIFKKLSTFETPNMHI
jgi:4'-phosphopantetheinyl transferase